MGPPMALVARSSGSITLTCSAIGNPSPAVSWYRDGVRLAGVQGRQGGLGEAWAKLNLPCITSEDAGLYECVAEAAEDKFLQPPRWRWSVTRIPVVCRAVREVADR